LSTSSTTGSLDEEYRMSVEVLTLSGLPVAEAVSAATALLDIDSGGPDRVDRLLVLDDTALLADHLNVYQRIDTSHRVGKLMCVAMGPRPAGERRLRLPGNLGGVQGSPVLWVSRPAGIDWKVAKSLVANRHPGAAPATVDRRHPLVGLLCVPEMFDRVHQTFLDQVAGRVASPGLWLAGEEDETATFAGALAVAIRQVCDPGPGLEGPFAELMPDRAGGARLAEAGPLARYFARVGEADRAATRALERAGGIGGRLKPGGADVPGQVAQVGRALADLRELVDQVLRDANVDGGLGDLTPNQRALVRNAGIAFEAEGAAAASRATLAAGEQSAVLRAVAGSVRGGDSIPSVGERLIATEGGVGRKGSASYRPEVEARCPAAFLASLVTPPPKVPRRGGVAEARHQLGLDGAVRAASALTDLIISVANREWSPGTVTPTELIRAKAALDGSRRALTGFASTAGPSGTRAARLARLGHSLVPALRDLVLRCVAAELSAPSASGPEALRVARDRTAELLREWTGLVREHGVPAQPSFASSGTSGGGAPGGPPVIEDEVARVREALQYPPRDEMWQLCAPADLSALDVDAPTVSVRFASRLARDALAGLPGDEPVWTSSGAFAGVLRLVPLWPGLVSPTWSES
jgi:hypothetical protein